MALLPIRRRAMAYTLLEVMVVVVLMGLVAALVVPRFASVTGQVERDKLFTDLIQLDAQARQLARQGKWCMVRWDADEHRMHLVQGRSEPRIVRSVLIDDPILLDSEALEQPIVFNTFGQSQDYGYRVLDGGTIAAQVRFNGLSGWHEVD